MAGGTSLIAELAALALLAAFVRFMKWLEKKGQKQRRVRRNTRPLPSAKNPVLDHNPGGPLTDKQAQKLFEIILQAAIRQKADTILIDAISGRPQVRLRLEGRFQELTGVGDAESFRRLVAQARRCAGLPAAAATAREARGSFLRLYRRGHLVNAGWRNENGERPVRFR